MNKYSASNKNKFTTKYHDIIALMRLKYSTYIFFNTEKKEHAHSV